MSALSWIGVIAGVAGIAIAWFSLRASRKSADASEEANRIAAEAGAAANASNEIARDAAKEADRSASAAERSAEAAEAHVELERARRAAQLFIRAAPTWSQGAPGTSTLVVELANSGGSIAEDVRITGITVDEARSPLAEDPFVVAPGEPTPVTLRLQIPLPQGKRRPFKLNVRYRDEVGEREQTINHYPNA
jgi:hypothetical protein